MRFNASRIAIALFVMLIGWSLPGYAQTMNLVTGNNLAPYTDIQLPKGGMISEIVSAVYAEMGFDTNINFGSWENGFADTLDGRFQATFPYQPDQVMSDQFFLSQALLQVRQSVFVSSRDDARFWTLGDLADKTFCVPMNYRLNREVQNLLMQNSETARRPQTLADCFRMLTDGLVSYVPSYDLLGRYMIASAGLGGGEVAILREPLSVGTFHLLIPKTQPNAVGHRQNFDRALERVVRRGEVQDIIRRHLSSFN